MGEGKACTRLASFYIPYSRQYYKLLKKACNAGDGYACLWPIDTRNIANPVIKRSCLGGDEATCVELSQWDQFNGLKVDFSKAYRSACVKGSMYGCYSMAADEKNEQKKLEETRNLCQNGLGLACDAFGRLIEAKDPKKAIAAFSKGCNFNDPNSCLDKVMARGNISWKYLNSTKPEPNQKQFEPIAKAIFSLCEKGYAPACPTSGTIFRKLGQYQLANEAYYNGCLRQDTWSCSSFAYYNYCSDAKIALAAYNNACDLGVINACKTLLLNPPTGPSSAHCK